MCVCVWVFIIHDLYSEVHFFISCNARLIRRWVFCRPTSGRSIAGTPTHTSWTVAMA